jgi:hypothetical protein
MTEVNGKGKHTVAQLASGQAQKDRQVTKNTERNTTLEEIKKSVMN